MSENYKSIIEAALFTSHEPLSIEKMKWLFAEDKKPTSSTLKQIIEALRNEYVSRGIQLKETASGYRFQTSVEVEPWLRRLLEKRPPRYSRALLETLAIILYRQPISRGEIESIRGVTVASDIIKKLLEREWIQIVGHREAPGKPALLGTTQQFLDYFNLKDLSELPPLQLVVDLEKLENEIRDQLAFSNPKDARNITDQPTTTSITSGS